MRWIILLSCLLAVRASDVPHHCGKEIKDAGEGINNIVGTRSILGRHCLSRPRKFTNHENRVENLMLKEIEQSYELLLMSHQFGTDVKDRPGFKKYLESLSDKAWENAIKITKYINRRGSSLSQIKSGVKLTHNDTGYIGEELASLGAAMDMSQSVIHDLHEIHREARKEIHADPDLGKHMEDMLKSEISDVRTLAGYITVLNSMYDEKQKGLAIFHFDDMLKEE